MSVKAAEVPQNQNQTLAQRKLNNTGSFTDNQLLLPFGDETSPLIDTTDVDFNRAYSNPAANSQDPVELNGQKTVHELLSYQ